jgi:hypothetical protein
VAPFQLRNVCVFNTKAKRVQRLTHSRICVCICMYLCMYAGVRALKAENERRTAILARARTIKHTTTEVEKIDLPVNDLIQRQLTSLFKRTAEQQITEKQEEQQAVNKDREVMLHRRIEERTQAKQHAKKILKQSEDGGLTAVRERLINPPLAMKPPGDQGNGEHVAATSAGNTHLYQLANGQVVVATTDELKATLGDERRRKRRERRARRLTGRGQGTT